MNVIEYHNALSAHESLNHSGITGMHWGRRRFQNEDGTYTELGKERRRIGGPKTLKSMSRKERKAAEKEAKAKIKAVQDAKDFEEKKRVAIQLGDPDFAAKHIDKFTNQEINDIITRYNTKMNLYRITTKPETVATRLNAMLDKWNPTLDKVSKFTTSTKTIYSNISDMSKKAESKSKDSDSKPKQETKQEKKSLFSKETKKDKQKDWLPDDSKYAKYEKAFEEKEQARREKQEQKHRKEMEKLDKQQAKAQERAERKAQREADAASWKAWQEDYNRKYHNVHEDRYDYKVAPQAMTVKMRNVSNYYDPDDLFKRFS